MAVGKPAEKDSVFKTGVRVLYLPEDKDFLIDEGKKYYGNPVFSSDGVKLAYTATNDSNETGTRRMQLFMSSLKDSPSSPKEFRLEVYSGRKGPYLQRPHSSDPEIQERLLKEWQEKMAQNAPSSLYVNQYSKPEFSHNGRRN